MRVALLVMVVAAATLTVVSTASAHSPMTAIGRAVTGLESVQVTYDPEATLGAREADGLQLRVRDTPVSVAVMPAFALEEIAGGADAVAGEIAREASLDGSLVVVAGTSLGAWSNTVDESELDAIVASTRKTAADQELGVAVEDLVAKVVAATPPPGSAFPWVWVAVGTTVVLAVVLVLWLRRQSQATADA